MQEQKKENRERENKYHISEFTKSCGLLFQSNAYNQSTSASSGAVQNMPMTAIHKT